MIYMLLSTSYDRFQERTGNRPPPWVLCFQCLDFRTCVEYLYLCWILMSELETYETYVCVVYLCWILMFVIDIYVCVGYLCLWWYLWCIMWYMWCICGIFCLFGWNIKKVYTGHFAECDTRQRGALSSVRGIALGKEPRPRTGIGSLPSVVALTLGKEPRFAECHTRHSAKYLTEGPL
jgi:hypothetical protein